MDNDDAYDMGYTDGHQDGERGAWLVATPIIHSLRAALKEIAKYEIDEGCPCSACQHSALARAALGGE